MWTWCWPTSTAPPPLRSHSRRRHVPRKLEAAQPEPPQASGTGVQQQGDHSPHAIGPLRAAAPSRWWRVRAGANCHSNDTQSQMTIKRRSLLYTIQGERENQNQTLPSTVGILPRTSLCWSAAPHYRCSQPLILRHRVRGLLPGVTTTCLKPGILE